MKKDRCNSCGRTLKMENNITCEDFVYIKKEWGYFSEKDGVTHEMIICETCMKRLEEKFSIPVIEYETIELI